MAEFSKNIWSPWRIEYIKALNQGDDSGCFMCQYWNNPPQDRKNHVLWRTEHCFAVLNKYPYTGGHLLVAPSLHVGDLNDLATDALTDVMTLLRDAKTLLAHVIHAEGFNMGINIGQCAGAGLPDHVHAHLVPRWIGDTSFVPILSDARLIPQMLDDLYQHLVEAAPKLDLPPLTGADQ